MLYSDRQPTMTDQNSAARRRRNKNRRNSSFSPSRGKDIMDLRGGGDDTEEKSSSAPNKDVDKVQAPVHHNQDQGVEGVKASIHQDDDETKGLVHQTQEHQGGARHDPGRTPAPATARTPSQEPRPASSSHHAYTARTQKQEGIAGQRWNKDHAHPAVDLPRHVYEQWG